MITDLVLARKTKINGLNVWLFVIGPMLNEMLHTGMLSRYLRHKWIWKIKSIENTKLQLTKGIEIYLDISAAL